EIIREIEVAVYPRAGFNLGDVEEGLRGRVLFVEAPGLDISSSEIRRRVFSGLPFRYLVPSRVYDYIKAKSLYR
ncbi:MAG TPA: nicotinic acid mononucleotide adenylyltransferase, partial [bacterium]|nr:nicotinic acid mononucleotide adenylyltransferase [bacterium]